MSLFDEFGDTLDLFAQLAQLAGEDGDFGFELGHAFVQFFAIL